MSSIANAQEITRQAELMNILPNQEGGAILLQQNAAITLIFSRPIIELGSDWGEDEKNNVFTFEAPSDTKISASSCIDATLIGKGRWVTTSIYRFDPNVERGWPTDLDCVLRLKEDLVSYDGMKIIPQEMIATNGYYRFKTSPQSAYVRDVTSEKAMELTNGRWSSHIPKVQANECPFDCEMRVEFNYPADVGLIKKVIQISPEEATTTTSTTTIPAIATIDSVVPCNPTTAETKCILIQPRNLQHGKGLKYRISFPENSILNANTGPISTPIEFSVTGLLPFSFDFLQEKPPTKAYNEIRPMWERYSLYIRHGISDSIKDNLASSITLEKMTGKQFEAVDVKIEFNTNYSVVVSGPIEPNTKYKLRVKKNADALDGFDLPLQSSSSIFTTAPLEGFFINPGTNKHDVIVFKTSIAPEELLTVYQNSKTNPLSFRSYNKNSDFDTPYKVSLATVDVSTDELFQNGIRASMDYNSKQIGKESFVKNWATKEVDLVAKGINTLSLPLKKNSLYVREVQTYEYGKTIHWISVTDLNVSFMSSGKSSLIGWVTRYSTGEVVAGATVKVFGVTGYDANTSKIDRIASGTTDKDGVADMVAKILTNSNSRRPNSYIALVTFEDERAVSNNVPSVYDNHSSSIHALFTADRGLYNNGDKIHLAGYVRDREGSSYSVPSNEVDKFVASIQWDPSSKAVDYSLELSSDGLGSLTSSNYYVDDEADTDVTGWIVVPSHATPGSKGLIIRKLASSAAAAPLGDNTGTFITSIQIVVGNPRPPTVKLSLESLNDVLLPQDNSAEISLSLETSTYTGTAVGDAEVKLTWNIVRGSTVVNGYQNYGGASMAQRYQSVSTNTDVAETGIVTLRSDSDGLIKYSTTAEKLFGEALLSNLPLRDGDSIGLSAVWVGPTRERITMDTSVQVATSSYKIVLDLSVDDPLPGFDFIVTPDMLDSDGASVTSDDTFITLILEEINDSSDGMETTAIEVSRCSFDLSISKSVNSKNDGKCVFNMPKSSAYRLSASSTDAKGRDVEYTMKLGRSYEDWEANPLTTLPLDGFSFDKSTYEIGDTAYLKIWNPFTSSVSLLMKWGNILSEEDPLYEPHQQLTQTLDAQDANSFITIEVPIGNECVGGCSFIALLVSSATSEVLLPVDIPMSKLLVDPYTAAHTIAYSYQIEVKDTDRELSIQWKVEQDETNSGESPVINSGSSNGSGIVLEPGESGVITVSVNNQDNKPIESGSVHVMLVDESMYDLKPLPVPQVEYQMALNLLQGFISSSQTMTVSSSGYTDTFSAFMRRVNMDPWCILMEWPLENFTEYYNHYIPDVDVTDDMYFKNRITDITSFPFTPYHDGAFYNDGMRSRSGDVMSVAEGMEMAPNGMAVGGASAPMMEMDAVMPEMAGDEMMISKSGAAASSADMEIKSKSGGLDIFEVDVRENFITTPIFSANVRIEDGLAAIPFKLPDNVGSYRIRILAASNKDQFGSFESPGAVLTRRILSLESTAPRIARLGDVFEAGVVCILTDDVPDNSEIVVTLTSYDKNFVTLKDGEDLFKQTVTINTETSKTLPVRFKFEASSASMGNIELIFQASIVLPVDSNDSTARRVFNDALSITLPLIGQQPDVTVGTSMVVEGYTASSADEGIVMPNAVEGSGGLNIAAGVGYQANILTISESGLIIDPNSKLFTPIKYVWSALSGIAPHMALSHYDSSKISDEHSIFHKNAIVSWELATELLPKFTDNRLGLRWHIQDVTNSYSNLRNVDVYLNSLGLMVVGLHSTDISLSKPLESSVSIWCKALSRELSNQIVSTKQHENEYTDYSTLSQAYFALLLNPSCSAQFSDLERNSGIPLSTVVDKVSNKKDHYSLHTVIMTALAAHHSNNKISLSKFVTHIENHIRVQGRTAYLTSSITGGSGGAIPVMSQALGLYALNVIPDTRSVLTKKLAAYVATPTHLKGYWAGSISSIFTIYSLALNDVINQNTSPNLHLTVGLSNGMNIVDNVFDSASDSVLNYYSTWEDLHLTKEENRISFEADGTGEVSLALSMNFVPATVFSFPIYRGILVEKFIHKVDPLTGKAIGDPLQLIEVGETVIVTIEITSPDDLQRVSVIDFSVAGLESIDPNVDSSMSGNSVDFGINQRGNGYRNYMTCFFRYWNPFGNTRETYRDKVTWFANRLSQGTVSVSYYATAATTGVFSLPPTKVFVEEQPEVMGLSRGGDSFVITSESIKSDMIIDILERSGVSVKEASSFRVQVKECDSTAIVAEGSICNLETGEWMCEVNYTLVPCSVKTTNVDEDGETVTEHGSSNGGAIYGPTQLADTHLGDDDGCNRSMSGICWLQILGLLAVQLMWNLF